MSNADFMPLPVGLHLGDPQAAEALERKRRALLNSDRLPEHVRARLGLPRQADLDLRVVRFDRGA